MTDASAGDRPGILRLAPLWALMLGAIGFICGFFGPLTFSPEANQGPLLGIFIAGPGGLISGFVLGVIASLLPLSPRSRKGLLAAAGIAVAGVTLYYSMPLPEYRGRIIDAEITGCATPASAVGAAVNRWQVSIANVTWASARTGWQEDALRAAQTDPGVVLELRIYRDRAVYQNRKPWNKGTFKPGEWRTTVQVKRFYARHAGAACTAYPTGKRELYFPVSESEVAGTWPPKALPNLLDLQVLGPVPENYRSLTDG